MKLTVVFGFVFSAFVFQISAQEQAPNGLTEAESGAISEKINQLIVELGNETYLAREKATYDLLDWLARTETVSQSNDQDERCRLEKSRRIEIRFKIQTALENAKRNDEDLEIRSRAERVLEFFESLKQGERYGIVISDNENIEDFFGFSARVNHLMGVLSDPHINRIEEYNQYDFSIMVENGPGVLPILSDALLRDEQNRFFSVACMKIIDILGQIGKPAIETLAKVLANNGEFSEIRKLAGTKIIEISQKFDIQEDAAQIFIQFIDAAKPETNPETRRWAVLEIGKLQSEAAMQKLASLVDAENETSFDVRCCAITALNLFGDASTIPALEKVISTDYYPYLREEAQKALDKIKERSKQ